MSSEAKARVAAGYDIGPRTKPPDWHGLVAADLLLNNLTTGIFLTAALGELAAPRLFTDLARIAYPIALVLLAAELVCLVLDLGDPTRFHHMLRVFKPSSPMSLGTWALTIYSVPLAICAVLSVFTAKESWLESVRLAAVAAGIIPALASACYKGVLLSTNAQPGWRDARWMGGYLGNSAMMLGCAGMLALSIINGCNDAASILRPVLALMLVINAIIFCLLLANLLSGLSAHWKPRHIWSAGVFIIILAAVIPVMLLLLTETLLTTLIALVLTLAGNAIIRVLIIRIPHMHSNSSQPEA